MIRQGREELDTYEGGEGEGLKIGDEEEDTEEKQELWQADRSQPPGQRNHRFGKILLTRNVDRFMLVTREQVVNYIAEWG